MIKPSRTAGLSTLFPTYWHLWKSVWICVCVTHSIVLHQTTPSPPPDPPGMSMSLHDSNAICLCLSVYNTGLHWERETETWRLKHGARINNLMEQIRKDNVWWLSACAFEYLSSSLAPGGGVEKWEGAGGAGDCGLRAPRGHTLRGRAGPGKHKNTNIKLIWSDGAL